jgi:hypothetical protein
MMKDPTREEQEKANALLGEVEELRKKARKF